MVHESLFNRPKEVLGCYRLGQEVIRARLDSLHSGGNVVIASEENDRQRGAEFCQSLLQPRTIQAGYPHIKQDAARDAFDGK